MSTKGLKDRSSKNRFTSGEALTESEFMQGIERTEKGAFHTVQESMKRFESWLKKREKK
jgi:predicted transcriptional regulator